MIYLVFLRALLVLCCFSTSFFLECPPSPRAKTTRLPGAREDSFADFQKTESAHKLASEDDVVPVVDKPHHRQDRFDSGSTVMSGLENDGSRLSSARHSSADDEVDDTDGEALEAVAPPADGAVLVTGGGDSASAISSCFSVACASDVCLEERGGNDSKDGDLPVVVSTSEGACEADHEGDGNKVGGVSLSSVSRRRDSGFLGHGVGVSSVWAASGTSLGQPIPVRIDPRCKEYAWEGCVDPYRAGEEKGIEIYTALAARPDAVFKCICKCDSKCGDISYFDGTVYEQSADRYSLKLIKFWRSVQRAVIFCLADPLTTGTMHGLARFKSIVALGDRACVDFVKRCEARISECFNPCFESTNRANLLYWASCKVLFTTCFFENRRIKDAFNYFEAGKNDGALKNYSAIAEDLRAYCAIPIAHFEKSGHPSSVAVLKYWRGFKVGLEQLLKLVGD